MRFIFNLSCSFEPADDSEDDELPSAEFFFVLDAAQSQKLHFQDDGTPEFSAYQAWLGATAGKFEDKFNAVHDFSGTNDERAWMDGFSTYELPTPERAYEVAQCWRDAYAEFLGSEAGMSPVVCMDGQEAETVQMCDAGAVLDAIERRLANGTPCSAAPRP